jgi:hypothetical protein
MVDLKSFGTKHKSFTPIGLVAVLTCIFLAGACGRSSGLTGEVADSSTNAPVLSAADPLAMTGLRFHEGDGTSLQHLDIILLPQGQDGQTLNIVGTLEVKLWDLADPVNLGLGDLLGEWTSVPVTAADFTSGGTLVKLDFQGFKPVPGQMGYIRLTLTAGGRSVSAEGPFQVLKESCCLPTTSP